jgi:hypothetical protein
MKDRLILTAFILPVIIVIVAAITHNDIVGLVFGLGVIAGVFASVFIGWPTDKQHAWSRGYKQGERDTMQLAIDNSMREMRRNG